MTGLSEDQLKPTIKQEDAKLKEMGRKFKPLIITEITRSLTNKMDKLGTLKRKQQEY